MAKSKGWSRPGLCSDPHLSMSGGAGVMRAENTRSLAATGCPLGSEGWGDDGLGPRRQSPCLVPDVERGRGASKACAARLLTPVLPSRRRTQLLELSRCRLPRSAGSRRLPRRSPLAILSITHSPTLRPFPPDKPRPDLGYQKGTRR